MLENSLTNLNSYTIANHRKFVDLGKYYQQSVSKLAQSTDEIEKKRISALFKDFPGYKHPYFNTFL